MKEDELLDTLKDILLEDERKVQDRVEAQLKYLHEELMEPEKLKRKMEPHLKENVTYVQENFSILFGDRVTQSIKDQIINSRDDVIEALYPIMGKLIKKYIQAEIAKLSEKIDQQVSRTFSLELWKRRIMALFSGTKESEMIIAELGKPVVEEVFVIQKNSGLLLGSYSINNTMDRDMIAGMFTAIKSFVEDAFSKGEDLETIEYESYKILVQGFPKYYIAVCISGVINSAFKSNLQETLFDFSEKELNFPIQEVNDELVSNISTKLENTFTTEPTSEPHERDQ